METLLIFAATGVAAGLLAGLFGVGGGLIMVPALALVLPWQGVGPAVVMQVSIGTSLAVISATSVSSMLAHHRQQGVLWDVFLRFAPGLAVGAVVGQLAKLNGARVVGIAGGADKCRYAVEELGFDACLDRREGRLQERLAAACPDGIDVYFENVGGAVLDAVLPLLNLGARVPVGGFIAHYNPSSPSSREDLRPQLLATVLQKRVRMQGFIILDHYADRFEQFRSDMGQWLAAGRVKLREDRVNGLEQAPSAFIGLLEGNNFGKLIVDVAWK